MASATHGESQTEILGSGTSHQPRQSFSCSKSSISQLPALSESGYEPELIIQVNDVKWRHGKNLPEISPAGEEFLVDVDSEQETRILFGDGINGSRLPSGIGNVKSKYRVGLGLVGNLDRDRISQIVSPPLGIEKAVNPVVATGGVAPESPSQGKQNLPIKSACLNRIVSVRDYEFFARNFAGIAKASATKTEFNGKEFTHITIAGTDDAPILEESLIFKNVVRSIEKFGGGVYWGLGEIVPAMFFRAEKKDVEGQVGFHVAMRRRVLLQISATIKIDDQAKSETVIESVRERLLGQYSFENSGFGKDVFRSDIASTIQTVANVLHVEIKSFVGIRESNDRDLLELFTTEEPTINGLQEELKIKKLKDKPDKPNYRSNLNDRIVANLKKYFVTSVDFENQEIKGLFPGEIAYFPPDIPEMIDLRVLK